MVSSSSQVISCPTIFQTSSNQCLFQSSPVKMRVVPAVGMGPNINDTLDAVLQQQAQQFFQRMVAMSNGIQMNHL